MGKYDDIFGVETEDQPAAPKGQYDDIFGLTPKRTVTGTAKDLGISALKGAIGVGEAIQGLADIPTGGRVGKFTEGLGYKPKEAKAILDTYMSPAQQAANKQVEQAEGFVGTLGTMVENPSTIVHAGVESLPLMGGGGVVGRGLTKLAPKVAPWIAGAVGEGVVGAGSVAEQIRQQSSDGLLTPTQSGMAVASGLGTGALNMVGGRLAQKFGFADPDTMLVQGLGKNISREAAEQGEKGVIRRIIEGGISEGVFEEMTQSAQEQVWQNAATGKPLMEGVGEASAAGLLTGAAMGAGANILPQGRAEVQPPPPLPKLAEPQLNSPLTNAVAGAGWMHTSRATEDPSLNEWAAQTAESRLYNERRNTSSTKAAADQKKQQDNAAKNAEMYRLVREYQNQGSGWMHTEKAEDKSQPFTMRPSEEMYSPFSPELVSQAKQKALPPSPWMHSKAGPGPMDREDAEWTQQSAKSKLYNREKNTKPEEGDPKNAEMDRQVKQYQEKDDSGWLPGSRPEGVVSRKKGESIKAFRERLRAEREGASPGQEKRPQVGHADTVANGSALSPKNDIPEPTGAQGEAGKEAGRNQPPKSVSGQEGEGIRLGEVGKSDGTGGGVKGGVKTAPETTDETVKDQEFTPDTDGVKDGAPDGAIEPGPNAVTTPPVSVSKTGKNEAQTDSPLTGETEQGEVVNGQASQQSNPTERFDYGRGDSVSPAAAELRAKSYPKQRNDDDVLMGSSDNYVAHGDAVELAREAIETGGIMPTPFQIAMALDIAPVYAGDVLKAAQVKGTPATLTNPALKESEGGAEEPAQPPKQNVGGRKRYSATSEAQQEREVTRESVENALPGATVTPSASGFIAELPNGASIIINTDATIEMDRKAASAALGRNVGDNTVAQGAFISIGYDGLIQLAKQHDAQTLDHEVYHAAEEMALNRGEIEQLRDRYGSAEATADAYAKWKGENHKLFEKIKNFFARILDTLHPNARGTFGKIGRGEVWGRTEVADGIIDIDGAVSVDYSVRTAEGSIDKFTEYVVGNGIATKAEADKYAQDIRSVSALILGRPALDYEASKQYTSVKPNSDPHYKLSLDFSTICKKRIRLAATIEALQVRLGRGLSPKEIGAVREALQKNKPERIIVSCGACYVDATRINLGLAAERFLNSNRKYESLREKFLTQRGMDDLSVNHEDAYNSFLKYIRPQLIKIGESRTEYRDEILDPKVVTEEDVKTFNARSGLRWQSWSDFEVPHLIDAMQAILHMHARGMKGHAYTKVADMVRALGRSGLLINMSLIPEGTGIKDGKLVFSPIEGMPYEDMLALRKGHSETAGSIAIGISDEHIRLLMADPTIDYIIPYHSSGLPKFIRKREGMDKWVDYTKTQSEDVADKTLLAKHGTLEKFKEWAGRIDSWWDVNKTGDENAQVYLNKAEAWGIKPKFEAFSKESGYWKMLTDRKMYDNDGIGIEQQAVRPEYDMKFVRDMLKDYVPEVTEAHGPTVDKLAEKFPAVLPRKEMMTGAQIDMADKHNVWLGTKPGDRTKQQERSVRGLTAKVIRGLVGRSKMAEGATKKSLTADERAGVNYLFEAEKFEIGFPGEIKSIQNLVKRFDGMTDNRLRLELRRVSGAEVKSQPQYSTAQSIPPQSRADIAAEVTAQVGRIRGRRLLAGFEILGSQEEARRIIAEWESATVKRSENGAIQGLYARGKAFLVADGIEKGKAMGVIIHELGEHAAKLGFAKDAEYRAILKMLENSQNEQGARGEAIRKALKRARDANTQPKHLWSEVAAYLVEDNANTKLGIVDRILNFFKKWLFQAGRISADKFSVADIVQFARAATMAHTGATYSEGVKQSVREARFKPVDVGSENFKKWFGQSKITKNGQPHILYHGTSHPRFLKDGEYPWLFDQNMPRNAGNSNLSGLGIFLGGMDAAEAHAGMGGTVHPFYVRIQNPYVTRAAELEKKVEASGAEVFRKRLQELSGHDGIIITDRGHAIAFDANQVKSAEQNTGAFSRENDDVRYSMAAERQRVLGEEVNRVLDSVAKDGISGAAEQRLFSAMAEGLDIVDTADADIRTKAWDWFAALPKAIARKGLGALTLRQLRDVFAAKIPQMDRFYQASRDIAADANRLMTAADETYNKWAKLDKRNAKAMSEVMIRATIAGVNPDVDKFEPRANIKALRAGIDANLARIAEINAKGAAATQEETSERERLEAKTRDKADRIQNEVKRRAEFDKISFAYQGLSKEAKVVYQAVKNQYTDNLNALFEALQDRIERQIKDPKQRKHAVDAIRLRYDKYLKEGPYFPLSRFGDYIAIAEMDGGVKREVRTFDSMAERTRYTRERRAEGWTVQEKTKKDFSRETQGASGSFFEGIVKIINENEGMGAAERKALVDEVNQHFIKSMPDLSHRKHFAHRRKVEGYSRDQMRAFADNMQHAAHHIARIRHADKMNTSVESILKESRMLEKDTNGDAYVDLYNELNKRLEIMNNPDISPVTQAITSFGFVMNIGPSIASAMVNMSQTPLVAFPVLATRFKKTGTMGAMSALTKASADYFTSKPKWETGPSLLDNKKLPQDERDMIRALIDDGTIDVTQAHSLAQAAGNDYFNLARTKYGHLGARIMRLVSYPFHVTELANRKITALAAYRLARQNGSGATEAIAQTREIVLDSHFDYSQQNRARWMEGNTRRVLLLFKQYSQQMTWLLGRSFHQAAKGETKEVRQAAGKQLSMILAGHFMVAGAMGLPMFGGILGTLSFLAGMFGDDDDPKDYETSLRNWLADTFGKTAGDIAMNGPWRALPGAGQLDVSNRMSLGDLWFRAPNKEMEGRDQFNQYVNLLLGPVATNAANVFMGLNSMANGETWRGIETMLPKAIKDSMKAMRYSTEGVKNWQHDTLLDDLGAVELFGQALGFTPSRVSEMYSGANAIKNHETRIGRRRTVLMNRWVNAVREHDSEKARDALEAITTFNSKNPVFRIDYRKNLIPSLRNRMKIQAQTKDGVYVPATKNEIRQVGRFANI